MAYQDRYVDNGLGCDLSDSDLHERYDEMLNEVFGTVSIGDLSYAHAYALKNVDPIAYRCGFNDWLDSEIQDGTIVEVSA